MALPTYVGKGPHAWKESSPLSVAWPAHVAGDVGFLVVVQSRDNTIFVTPSFIPSVSGWTEITDARHSYNHGAIQVYYKVALGGDANASVPSAMESYMLITGRIYCFRGTATGVPFEGLAVTKGGSDSTDVNTPIPSSSPATGPDRLAIALCPIERNKAGAINNGWSEQDDTTYATAVPFRSSNHFMAIYPSAIQAGAKSPAATLTRANVFKYSPFVNLVLLLKPSGEKHEVTGAFINESEIQGGVIREIPFVSDTYGSLEGESSIAGTATLEGGAPTLRIEVGECYFEATASLVTDVRARLKSRFLPSKVLFYDDIAELIDFTIPDFTGSVAQMVAAEGLLTSLATASAQRSLDVLSLTPYAQTIIECSTTAQLSSKLAVAGGSQKLPLGKAFAAVQGVSASRSSFKAIDNPISVGLPRRQAFTSASATNVNINEFGLCTFAFSTVQSSKITTVDRSVGVTGIEVPLYMSANSFDLYYYNVALIGTNRARLQLGKSGVFIQGYRVLELSAVAVSSTGVPLGSVRANDSGSQKKHGVIHGYKTPNNIWQIYNKGFNRSTSYVAMAYCTASATVNSLRITGGEVATGDCRLITYNVGQK